MSVKIDAVSGDKCMQTIERLDAMKIRFAGTAQERRAADWIRERFKRLRLKQVQIQEFPCLTFSCSRRTLRARMNGRWKKVPVEVAAHSSSTPARGTTAQLIRVERIPSNIRQCRRLMRDKVVLLYSSQLFQFGSFKRVMTARPAGVLLVDDRFPNDWTVAIGFPRYWIDFIACPILNIPYQSAWTLVQKGVREVRLEVRTAVSEAPSQNVIGEIPGSSRPGEIIVVSGHHDSVINNPGADDNCTGVASVLELARLFSKHQPRRTLRFISYGAEEQLSEGALYYAIHARDRKRIQFVLNSDAIGAHMGTTGIYYVGPRELTATLKQINAETRFPAHLHLEASPFSDHFPLSLAGIPVAWYYRTTYLAGRHFHHSALETPEVVSAAVLEATIRHQAVLLDRIANGSKLPFRRRLPASQRRKLRKLARDWCGFEELPSE